MSYDLLVFDPANAPRDRASFMAWYDQTTEWSEGHSYEDSGVTTPELQSWYHAMRSAWPPMNGPDAGFKDLPADSPLWDDPHVTGYTIGRHAIYCDFRWSVAREVRDAVISLAEQHGIGFFDVSGDSGTIAFPGEPYA